MSTYHIPPEAFSQIVRHTDHLKYLDAIIVVSSVQQDLFGDLIGPERVFFIPHGIDEKFFVPPAHGKSGPSETFKCIFVGTHMRDFETLSETAKILQDSKKEVRFTVITSPEFFHHFDGLSNISLFSGVSDQQLVKLYQESDLFVMPVKSCTANNSLLEAMSCGLPVVSNDLQAIRDYVDEECAVLTPQADAPALATAVNTLMDDRERLDRMAAASRKNCLRFTWEKIASRHLEVYEHISKLA